MSRKNGINSKGKGKKPPRREVLKAVGVAGALAAPSIRVGANASRSAGDGVEIVTHKSARGPEITKKVPRPWKEHIDHIEQVKDKLADRFLNQSGFQVVSMVGADEDYAGKQGFKLQMEVGESKLSNEVPEQVDGIPVETVEPRERVPESCDEDNETCYKTQEYDDTPGGVIFDSATSCCQYYRKEGYYDYTQTMLAAAHGVGNRCNEDLVGNSIVQYEVAGDQRGDDWGEVVEAEPGMDVALCEPTESGKSVDNVIAEQYGDLPIRGFVTKSGLKDIISSGEYVWNTGIMTGTSSGTIERIDTNSDSCNDDYQYDVFAGKLDTSSGDSGCPTYDYEEGEAYIIGIHTAGGASTDGVDCTCQNITTYSHGATAYEINDRLDGQFIAPL